MNVTTRKLTAAQRAKKTLQAIPQILRCARHFKNWTAITRWYAQPRTFNPPAVAIGRRNFQIHLWEPSDVQTLWAIFCHSNYQVPENPGVVLDLGANIGVFSIYAAKIKNATRIIALEPVSATFSKLRKNISSNHLESVVTCIPEGVGGSIGPRTIYCGSSSPHSSMYYRGDPRFESGTTETISITTIEDVLGRFNLQSIDLCKADCEGAEVEALLAAGDDVLHKIKSITMEYHFPAGTSDPQTFFTRLERAGFQPNWQSGVEKTATYVLK
jgi:FkbM family methyltransferase